VLERMRGGGKSAPPKQLTVAAPRNIPTVKMPALAVPDDDEWEEF
jgi:hypothetical protein